MSALTLDWRVGLANIQDKVDQSEIAMESLLRLSEVLVSFNQRVGDCLEGRMGLGTSSVTSEIVLCLMMGECLRFQYRCL